MKRVVLPLFITVLVAACGIEPGATTPTSVPDTTITTPDTTSTTVAPSTTTTPAPATTTPAPTTTTTSSTTATTLPGEPTELGPGRGDILMVAGVRHDDALNLRAAPGATQPIVGTIPPTEMALEALGETRVVATTFWTKVRHGELVGWVNTRYLGYAGTVDDRTAQVVDRLGEYPTAPTMRELGLVVAEVFASDDPEVTSRVVQVTPATGGDLSEATFDVIGYADDSIAGVRLHIFGQKVSDGYSLKTVEVRLICLRGVAGGVCS